jgi:hypothetical protein
MFVLKFLSLLLKLKFFFFSKFKDISDRMNNIKLSDQQQQHQNIPSNNNNNLNLNNINPLNGNHIKSQNEQEKVCF